MSSETSTDTLAPHRAGVRDGDPGLAPWQLFTLAGLIGATVVVFLSRGQTPAGIILLSLTIFTAAVVGLATWRTLAPFTVRNESAGPQMLGGRTRAALEREKALVLRSIKELEFDHAMGKVSAKDFAEMGARLRVRAAGLIGQLDASTGYRAQIDTEVARRMGRSHPGSLVNPDAATGAGSSRVESRDKGRPAPSPGACAACATVNDPDARFCKHCGAALGVRA